MNIKDQIPEYPELTLENVDPLDGVEDFLTYDEFCKKAINDMKLILRESKEKRKDKKNNQQNEQLKLDLL